MGRCYIFPVPKAKRRPSALHETGGLNGNWALDYMCDAGANVLSPVSGVVKRLSGHPPVTGVHPGAVFGYSLFLEDDDGYELFITHLKRRFVKQGDRVCVGKKLADVAGWPKDAPRTHAHIGITSPKGETDAKAQAKAMAQAIKLGLL